MISFIVHRFKGFRHKFPKHLEGWKKIYDSNVSYLRVEYRGVDKHQYGRIFFAVSLHVFTLSSANSCIV